MSERDPASNTTPGCHLLPRPGASFNQLPLKYRWEFTRRHPYYLLCWENAREFRTQPSDDDRLRLVQDCASMILQGCINVAPNVVPPDPHDDFDSLGGNTIGAGWEDGAVNPVQVRALAHTLLAVLPQSERAELGRIFTESANYDAYDSPGMQQVHGRLLALPGDIWNSSPDIPIMSVNLQMSQRAITTAVETLVRRWKQKRDIPEMRRRDDKLDEYLAVWDRREGWTGGSYDGAREQQFQEIAAELGVPLTTVANRYRAAFKHLSGHDYTPELWIRLFGQIKLSTLHDPSTDSRLARRRPWRTRNLRPVAESVLLPGRLEADNPRFLEGVGFTASDLGLVELQLDIQTLIQRGDSNEKIQEELDPDGELPNGLLSDLISALRSRQLAAP